MSISNIAGFNVYRFLLDPQSRNSSNGPTRSVDDAIAAPSTALSASLDTSSNKAGLTVPTAEQGDTLALQFGQAIGSASTVDPATGGRELVAGAGNKLTQTLSNLLTQNGFSADEAKEVASNVTDALAKEGTLSISLQESAQIVGASASLAKNGNGTTAAASIYASQISSTLNIGINPDGGYSVSADTRTSLLAVAASVNSNGRNGQTTGQAAGVAAQSDATASVSQVPISSLRESNPIKQLLDQLGDPQSSQSDDVSSLIQQPLRASDDARDEKSNKQDPAGEQADPTANAGSATSISINIKALLALHQTDGSGYGSTLYQRPDGSLGTYATKPINISA